MNSLKVGHQTNKDHGTGVTVFLFDEPARGTYYLCGSSPAARELHTLELEANVSHTDGLVFVGGSAFGLGAANGVMQWCKEHGKGYPTTYGVVPIIPCAAIYDLGECSSSPPSAEDAYEACRSAVEKNFLHGRIGAGTGATVGKLIPNADRMNGGIGHAELSFENGLKISAYAVVNSVGDVRDASGKIIAGARLKNGKFADCEKYLLSGSEEQTDLPSNTTLVAVFTNALFSKVELKRIAKMSVAGMARAISPIFTRYDGDFVFCFSLGKILASEMVVGAAAAEVVRLAILNAVTDAS